jgi:hypothetical protein
MAKGYILVEGHGEVEAAGNLVTRLWGRTGHALPWDRPRRCVNIHLRHGLARSVERIRARPDVGALLILRDADDECPRHKAPELAAWLRGFRLPFPAAVVLLHPEYEVLFLPCVDRMAGRPIVDDSGKPRVGLLPGSVYEGDWEAHRGVKEWLSRHFPRGRSYRPTQDQLPMTRMLDLDVVRAAGVPCFGTLERALGFLAMSIDAGTHDVYPSPAPDASLDPA